jgi:hypothetical protein
MRMIGIFLFDCNDNKQAWQSAGLDMLVLSQIHRFSLAKELDVCRFADRYRAGQFALLVWVLWNNRNNSVWNRTKETGQQLEARALSMWTEWDAASSS